MIFRKPHIDQHSTEFHFCLAFCLTTFCYGFVGLFICYFFLLAATKWTIFTYKLYLSYPLFSHIFTKYYQQVIHIVDVRTPRTDERCITSFIFSVIIRIICDKHREKLFTVRYFLWVPDANVHQLTRIKFQYTTIRKRLETYICTRCFIRRLTISVNEIEHSPKTVDTDDHYKLGCLKKFLKFANSVVLH